MPQFALGTSFTIGCPLGRLDGKKAEGRETDDLTKKVRFEENG